MIEPDTNPNDNQVSEPENEIILPLIAISNKSRSKLFSSAIASTAADTEPNTYILVGGRDNYLYVSV